MRLRNRRGNKHERVFADFFNAIPLDGNAKARIWAFVLAWSARHSRPGQHHGPVTMAFRRVLKTLLWYFHNSRSGYCFPSHKAIAAKAECSRDTVNEALKVLEWAGVLTWQHRIIRIRERCTDLFGRVSWRWRLVRTSNAYQFHDRTQRAEGRPSSKPENPAGTQDEVLLHPVVTPNSALERALASFGRALAAKNGIEQERGGEGAGIQAPQAT
jgi:hypothetical protein